MIYRTAKNILSEADKRGLRRAFIVTALPLEMAAVRAHLEDLGSVVGPRDGTIYECGIFQDPHQDWFVVVAETGAGNHPANSCVTHAHSLFCNFEIQIVVGVGGSRKNEVPLGTVVASDHVYSPYGGKYGPAGLSARPREFQVDFRLVQIAREGRAGQHLAESHHRFEKRRPAINRRQSDETHTDWDCRPNCVD